MEMRAFALAVRIFAAGFLAVGSFGSAVHSTPAVNPIAETDVAEAGETVLTLLTEQNAPYNFINPKTGSLEGSSVVLVRELMKQASVPYTLKLLPWRRAYRQAMNRANTCVFVANRTPDREDLFQWVGPVTASEGGWVFYKRPDSDIQINSIEDVKKHVVVGRGGSAPVNEFRKLEGAEVLASLTGKGAVELLYFGRADLWLVGAQDGPVTARLAGVPEPVPAFSWFDFELYMACHKEVNPELIEKLNHINTSLLQLRLDLSKQALSAAK